ncbi:cupin domain-containing protein [Desulfococcaceae bacterium HSG9]|nr:cupin domain-containing protein [Desulfococcaceae bacterium HSG9]
MNSQETKPHINVDFFEDLTGDIETPANTDIEDVGNRIRLLREKKGMSVEELSKMTGYDVELLSGIENNKVKPQLGTVIKLSRALDSAFSRLISGVGDKLYSVTRKNERRVISRSTSSKGQKKAYKYMSLAPDVKGRHMEALIVQLEENQSDERSVHDGEEFIYVIDGVVNLKIGEDSLDLEPGDSVYYLSTTPHLIAAKNGQSTILAVMYEG